MMYEINHHNRHHSKRESMSLFGLPEIVDTEFLQAPEKGLNLPKIDGGSTLSYLDSVSSLNG
jgi:hypothetical protein